MGAPHHDAETMIIRYMNAFCRQDLAEISGLLTSDVTLQDSFAPRISGRSQVLDAFRTMFEGTTYEMTLLRRFTSDGEGEGEAQEFRLVVTDASGGRTRVEGMDVFKFRDGLICEIRAYVEVHAVSSP